MTRLLVTGGAGFIGSNFVRRVLQGAYPELDGAEVIVYDKLTYAGTMESLAEVADHPRFTFVKADICDVTELPDVDVVVNFAAETHVDRSIAGGADFVRTNVMGVLRLLEAACRRGVERFVQVSTDEVYGSVAVGSSTESDALLPNSPYAASKAGADLLARAYWRTHGLPVCVTRCSNNYGPFQQPEKLIPLFLTNLLDGKQVPVYGDGLNVREWIHVDDHCRALALVACKGEPGQIYNIGSGVLLNNLELTARLLKLLDADESAIRFVADRKGHDRRYCLDSSKIARELGFHPTVPLEEGLAETARWYAANRDWWEPLKERWGHG